MTERGGGAGTVEVFVEVPVERERITVRLVAADLIVQYAWTREGEMVLVPHYRFRDADGGEWWVLAIADRYLEG